MTEDAKQEIQRVELRDISSRQPPADVDRFRGNGPRRLYPWQIVSRAERRHGVFLRAGGKRSGGQGSEVGFGAGETVLRLNVPGDGEHRIVGQVIAAEESSHVD